MNPEFPSNNPRAELETRLTAFILGELPAHEAAALRRTIDDDPELAALYDQLSAAHKLVREVVTRPAEPVGEPAAPLRLSEDRRQKLLAQFKTVAPKEFAPQTNPVRTKRLLQIAAAVTLVGSVAGLVLSYLSTSNHEVEEINVMSSRLAFSSPPAPPVPSAVAEKAQVYGSTLSKKQDGVELVNSTTQAVSRALTNTAIVLPPAEQATGRIVSTVRAQTNEHNLGLMVSTNYLDPGQRSRSTSVTSATLSGYIDTLENSNVDDGVARSHAALKAAKGDSFNFNYVDLNRNPTGAVSPRLSTNNSIGQLGDPEWIGFLEHPDQHHSSNNSFASRSGFTTVPENADIASVRKQAYAQIPAPVSSPAVKIVLPSTESSTELAKNATTTANFGANFSSPRYADTFTDGNRGGSFGRVSHTNAGDEVGIAYAKPSDISTALTALGPQNSGKATGGSGGGGAGNAVMAGRPVAAANSRSQDFVDLSLSQQAKPGDIDPATGLPIGPLPPNYSWPKIDPATGLPVEPPTAGNRTSDLQTRAYHVDPKDMQKAVKEVAGYGLQTAQAPTTGAGPGIVTKSHDINVDVGELYEAAGLDLKDRSGKAIAYNERTGTLTVRGTSEDLKMVDEVNKTLTTPPPQVSIKTKFAEISQDDTRALGFNWTTGNFSNGGSLIASGGTQPSLSGTNPLGNYPGATTYRQLSQGDVLTAPEVTTESGRSADRGPMLGDLPAIGSLPRAGTGQTASSYTENNKLRDLQAGHIPSQELIERIPAWHTNEIQTATMVQDGKLLLEAGKLDEAEAKLDEALRRDPGSVAAYQSLGFIEEKRLADSTRRSESAAADAVTQVEKAWDVEQRSGKLEARPAPKTITNAWSSSGSLKGFYDDEPAANPANKDSKVESFSFDDSAALAANPGVPLLVSTNSVSVDDVTFAAATDEAIRRQPDSITSNFIATNGVIGSKAYVTTLDGATVTIDPETKRVFYSTDEETSKQVADIIQRLDKKGATEPTKGQSQAYLDKKKELESLRAAQESMALRLAGHGVEYKMPTTLMVEVIEHADGKPAKKTFGESIGHIFTGKEIQTARIKIERDITDVPGVSGQPAMTGIYDPYFIQTESEVIRSEKILDRVVEQLGLKEAWGKKEGRGPLSIAEARAELKHSLEISPARNTSLLDIKVKSGDAAEAAKIANTVAEVYQDYRRKQREELVESGIKTGMAERAKKITQLEQELARLDGKNEEADVPLARHSTNAPIPQPEVRTTDNAFSTFSLNIADVSFKLAAASLEKGQMPDPASIRSEEFINAFDYRDPAPAAGAPLGFAWERAQYPFAHNRDLLRFSVKTAAAGREAGKPMNIVLLLDKSGSMERADRVRIVHEALRVLAGQLQPQDKLSVVTFARVARLWVDGLSGSQAGEVAEGLDKLTPEGGTNLEEAMRLAYETARRHYLAGGINRVVLLTDGAANLGNVEPASLEQSVEAHRKEGIALDCFGVGWEGYDDDLLEALARHGDGRYGFLNTADDAANGFAKQLAGALHVAAADVKVQVEFNPKRITAYRQIGYAKHQLTKEQFRDNTVDAAEIAAEESGNALYTIEVNPNGEGPLATVHVRYKVPGTQDYPEHQWEVPYTGGATALDQSSAAMRLAGTASAFSEWLATSPFAGEVTMDKLLRLMSGVPEIYGADERPKKLEWMIRQTKSLEGK